MSIALAKEVLNTEIDGIRAICENLDHEFDRAVDLLFSCPTRIIVTGIGKSGVVGQKIAATLNSTGSSSFFLHPVEALHGDLGMVSDSDVVLALSYSGETIELNRLLNYLIGRAIPVIAICGNMNSTLARLANIMLNVAVPKEACPLGLAPTTSTTASLAMGDALAVVLLNRKQFRAEDFRKNHPGGSLGERLKVAVEEVMLTGDEVPMVSISACTKNAIEILNQKNMGAVFVTDEKRSLVGIITDGDLRRLISHATTFSEKSIKQIMTVNPVTITPSVMAADALSLMQKFEITVLAVVDNRNCLIGILHLHNLLGKGEFRFLI